MSFTRLTNFLIPALAALFAGQCFAQSQCQVKPGEHTILIPLQNAPNSSEPACQPARIRVSDRAPVTLRLTGLSPIDVCLVTSKPQTVTTIANPLETLINTVSGLKSFDFEGANQFSADAIDSITLFRTAPPGQPPQRRRKRKKNCDSRMKRRPPKRRLLTMKPLGSLRVWQKTLSLWQNRCSLSKLLGRETTRQT